VSELAIQRAMTRKPSRGHLLTILGSRFLSVNAILMFAFLYVPILVLVVFSFNTATVIEGGRVLAATIWKGFTLHWYEVLIHDARIIDAMKNTLTVAIVSTLLSTVLGTMAALVLERHEFRGKLGFDAVLYLPIIIPEVVMALSLILFFVLIRLPQATITLSAAVSSISFLPAPVVSWLARIVNVTPITIAHVAFNISFVAVVVRSRIGDFDITLEEAAKDLGANEWQTFRRVTLPLIMPGILAGALLAFTLSIDDFVITFFVSGPGSTTLPVRVFSMIRIGVTPEVNAISSAMLIASIGLVILSVFSERR